MLWVGRNSEDIYAIYLRDLEIMHRDDLGGYQQVVFGPEPAPSDEGQVQQGTLED